MINKQTISNVNVNLTIILVAADILLFFVLLSAIGSIGADGSFAIVSETKIIISAQRVRIWCRIK